MRDRRTLFFVGVGRTLVNQSSNMHAPDRECDPARRQARVYSPLVDNFEAQVDPLRVGRIIVFCDPLAYERVLLAWKRAIRAHDASVGARVYAKVAAKAYAGERVTISLPGCTVRPRYQLTFLDLSLDSKDDCLAHRAAATHLCNAAVVVVASTATRVVKTPTARALCFLAFRRTKDSKRCDRKACCGS